MDEESLERQALEELLLDAKRGAERAKDMGALGWQKPSVPPANKRFLTNMLVSTLRDAERQARKQLDQIGTLRDSERQAKKQLDQFKEKSYHKFDTRQHPYKHERSSYIQKYNYSESYQRTSQKHEVGQSGTHAQQVPSKWDNDEKREHGSKLHIEVKEEENTNSTNVRAVDDDRSGSSGGDAVQDEVVSTYGKLTENNINQKQNFEDSKKGDKNKDFKIVKKNDTDLQDDLMDQNHIEKRKSKHEKSNNGLNSRLAEDSRKSKHEKSNNGLNSRLAEDSRKSKHEKSNNGLNSRLAEDSRKSKHEKSYNGLNSRLAEDSGAGLQFDNHLEESLSQNDYSLSDRTKQQTTTTVSKITGKGKKRKRKKVKSKGRHKGSEDYVSQMTFDLPRGNCSKIRKIDHKCKKNKSKKKPKQEKNDK